MNKITIKTLSDACSPGGSSCLSSVTELKPAGGPQASVAPAKFVGSNNSGVYAYEKRFIDGKQRQCVLIDSKQSQLNRAEAALLSAINDNHRLLVTLPRIEVIYERDGAVEKYCDLELPHRAFDGHIRAGKFDGEPVTKNSIYRELRNASQSNARALFDISPATIIFGGWDASRASRQGRWRSIVVGEVIGVCANSADNSDDRYKEAKKGGARIDPVGMQVNLSPSVIKTMADEQRDELTKKKYDEIVKDAKAKSGTLISASRFGVGGIPPTLEALAGVACERIFRSHVLSFAALRQIRFSAGLEGDIACRALLAAIALNALARSDAELSLRANCDLIESSPTVVTLDRRSGTTEEFNSLSIAEADQLLEEALELAKAKANVMWNGVELSVTGNPDIVAGAVEDQDEEQKG